MNSTLLERAKAFLKAHRKQNVWYRIMCVLASMVVFITTYMLILPAITMERETYCGMEEHTHTEECYQVLDTSEPVLNCTYDTLQVHEHTKDCYDAENHLICNKAAYVIHTHDANCYDANGTLICTLPEVKEHEHTDSCYATERTLVCGQQETTGHTHDSSCYTLERGSLICGAQEHTHGQGCYDENGQLICGLSQHQHNDDCYQWDKVLTCGQTESAGHAHTDSCYQTIRTLACGYDKLQVQKHQHTADCFIDGEAGSTRVLVCGKTEHQHSEVCYQENAAELLQAKADEEGLIEDPDAEVLLLEDGSLPEAGKAYVQSETVVDETEIESESAQTEMETETENEIMTEAETETESETETEAIFMLYATEEVHAPLLLEDSGEKTAVLNVTNTSGSASYNKNNDTYSVEMKIEFVIDNSNPDTVTQTSYVYNYPAGYPVPAALTEGSHTLYDKGGKNAGTYIFQENADGTFSVVVQIAEEYAKASTTGNTITGFISYKGTMEADGCTNENGDLEIGTGDTKITIPAGNINYPDGETHDYSVSTQKSGEYITENNQLVYTVYVYSMKETPDKISFKDVITANGLNLGTPNVAVVSVTGMVYGGWFSNTWEGGSAVSITDLDTSQSGTISMTLPKLSKPDDIEDNKQKINGYKITYTYDLSNVDAISLVANNKVEVKSSAGTSGPVVSDEADSSVTIDRTHTFEKSYSYDSSTGTILWTLTVNNNKANIAGAIITDEMFSQAVNGNITVTPASDYTYNSTANTITFNVENGGTSNNKTYTITYSTPVTSQWDAQTITNDAKFDPTPSDSSSGDEIEKNPSVTIDGGSVEKAKVSEAIAADRQSAIVEWKVTINVPASGLRSEMKITDTADSAISMTKAQVTNWDPVLYWKDANGNDISDGGAAYQVQISGTNVSFKGSDGNIYTLDAIKNNDKLNGLTFQLQEITLGDALGDALTPPEGASKLVFSYTTTVDLRSASEGWNKYTNKVTVSGKECSADFDYELKMPTLSKTHSNPTYIKVEDQVQYIDIPWTVTIEIPETGWMSGKILTDDLTKNQWNAGDVHTITYQNALDLVKSAKWENGSAVNFEDANKYKVTFTTKDGIEYTYQNLMSIEDEIMKSSLEFSSFTIKPLSTVIRPENETKIILNVTSRADVSEVAVDASKYYRNMAYIGNNNASDEYQYTNHQNSVVKYDGNWQTGTSNSTSSEGKVSWIVEVKLDDEEHKSISITDTLPAKVTPDTFKVNLESKGECYPTINADGTITGEVNGYTVFGNYEASSHVISLTVKKADGSAIDTSKIQFYINCLADDSLKDQASHELKNDVTAKVDEAEIGSSSQTQNWTYQEQTVTHDKVTKTGNWDNNARKLDYQVAINPDGEKLLEDPNATLYLVDTLTYFRINQGYQVKNNNGGTDWKNEVYHFQVNLLQDCVKLYYAKLDSGGNLIKDTTKNEVTGWSWTFAENSTEGTSQTTNTLTITGIPDGTPLIVEYAYQVSSDLPEKAVIESLAISNTARLYGANEIGSSSHWGGKWSEQTTTGQVDSNRRNLKLIKVEQGHFENVLEGAEFTVYQATGTSESGELMWSADAIRTYTTSNAGFTIEREEKGEDGINVEFTYAYNTLYKVVETKAPDGYVIPTPVKEYYFYFSSADDTTYTLPTSLPESSMDLSISAFTVYAENAKQPDETTEITVNKEWKDKGGNAVTDDLPQNVTVQLYQKVGDAETDEGSSAGGTAVNYTANCNYGAKITGTIENASVGDLVKIVIVYTWDAGNNFIMTDHEWAWTGVTDGIGKWADPSTYIYTGKITSNAISFDTGDNENSVNSITCTIESNGTVSASGGTTVEIAAGGTAYGDPITLSSPDWSYTWLDLPKSITQNGENAVCTYYVQEENVSGYDTSYVNNGGIQSGIITIVNEKTDTTNASITVEKKWEENGVPFTGTHDAITVELYKKGTDENSDTKVGDAVLNSDNGWCFGWTDLPMDGVYYVKEISVPSGYVTTYSYGDQSVLVPRDVSATDGSTITITNTRQITNVTVEKKWYIGETEITSETSEESHPQSVSVQLYQKGTDNNFVPYGSEVTLSANTDPAWSYTWLGLPEGEYYVLEADLPTGFTVLYGSEEGKVSENADGSQVVITGGTITVKNTKETTEYEVEKIWKDSSGNTLTEKMPEEIQVELYRKIKGSGSGGETEETTEEQTEEITEEQKEEVSNIIIKLAGWKDTNGNEVSGDVLTNEWWYINAHIYGKYVDNGELVNISDSYYNVITDKTDQTVLELVTKTTSGRNINYCVEYNGCGSGTGNLVRATIQKSDNNVFLVTGIVKAVEETEESDTDSDTPPADVSDDMVTVTINMRTDNYYGKIFDVMQIPVTKAKGIEFRAYVDRTNRTPEQWDPCVYYIFFNSEKLETSDSRISDVTPLYGSSWCFDSMKFVSGPLESDITIDVVYGLETVGLTTERLLLEILSDQTAEASLVALTNVMTMSGEGETLPTSTATITEPEKYGETVTLKPDTNGNWVYSWSNLPKYDAYGNEYEYYVREIVPDGYTASYEDTGTKTTITNTKGETTSITVQKVWKTYTGDTTTKSSGDALSIDLIRIATPETGGSPTETVVQTLSMLAPYQQIIVSDLPTFGTGADGTRYNYTYKVQEGSVSGYQVSYENNDGIVSGIIIIHNQSTTDEGYVLPETGGSGTWLYTVGGLLLSAMACLLLYIKNKRRKEEGCSS